MVFNSTENDKFTHKHNIVHIFPLAWGGGLTIEMPSNSPLKLPTTMGDC